MTQLANHFYDCILLSFSLKPDIQYSGLMWSPGTWLRMLEISLIALQVKISLSVFVSPNVLFHENELHFTM